jgi:hypothetical protein
MTKEALKLALEALEWNMDYLPSQGRGTSMARDAITAIKQARSAPVQEPVAQLGDGVLWCDTCRSVQETIHHTSPNDRDVWCKGEAAWLQGPFYTIPPEHHPEPTPPAAQRQWVGLTDEQFQAIRSRLSRQDGWDGDGWDLALKEAIEAKLKEKNT